MKNFFKNWNKKQKMSVGIVCVVGVLIISGAVLADSKESNQVSLQVEKKDLNEAEYERKVIQLVSEVYSDNSLESLAATFDQKKSAQIKELLEKAPKGNRTKSLKENEDQLTNAMHMFTVETELDAVYESEGIVKENAKLKDSEGLLVLLNESKPKFYTLQQKRMEEAKNQIAAIADAKNAVNDLFTDTTQKTVKEDVTKESYMAVVTRVEGLKQVSLKESLLATLTLVETKVTETEAAAVEAEKEEVAAIEAAQAEQASQNQASVSQNGQAPATNDYNGTVYASEGSQSGNVSTNEGTTQQPSTPQTPPSNSNDGESWSGSGTVTGGGTIGGGANGGAGDNTWTGGDFDGSGIDTSGWN